MLTRKISKILVVGVLILVCIMPMFGGLTKADAATNKISVDVNNKMQSYDGWGTALAWWANNYGGRTDRVNGKEYRKHIANMVFSEEGLNLNIARYNLGTPYNPEIDPNWNSVGNGKNYGQTCMDPLKMNKDDPFNWEMDARQIWMLEEFYKLQGDRAISEMWLNTSPWWTCVGDTPTGPSNKSDNILPAKFPEFAEYIVDALEYFKTYKGEDKGISFDYIEPMNEPTSGYGVSGDGNTNCRMSKGATQSGILNALSDELKKRNLDKNHLIAGCDEISITDAFQGYNMLDDKAKTSISKINTHSYYGTQEASQKGLKNLAYGTTPDYENPNKKIWLSERTLYMGPEPEAFFYGIKLAQEIIDNINIMGINAWCHWQAPDMMGLNGYGNSSGINWAYDMQYFTFGNFTRYITPGSRILNVGDASGYSVAALTPENKVVVVLSNGVDPNSPDTKLLKTPKDIAIEIDNANVLSVDMVRTSWASKGWTVKPVSQAPTQSIKDTLPPTSVTTYIFNLGEGGNSYKGCKSSIVTYSICGVVLVIAVAVTLALIVVTSKKKSRRG